jgi:hypothetical protein
MGKEQKASMTVAEREALAYVARCGSVWTDTAEQEFYAVLLSLQSKGLVVFTRRTAGNGFDVTVAS